MSFEFQRQGQTPNCPVTWPLHNVHPWPSPHYPHSPHYCWQWTALISSKTQDQAWGPVGILKNTAKYILAYRQTYRGQILFINKTLHRIPFPNLLKLYICPSYRNDHNSLKIPQIFGHSSWEVILVLKVLFLLLINLSI